MRPPRLISLLLGIAAIIVTSPAQSATLCTDTGHYYDFVQTYCGQTWTAAKNQAVASGGYLATVTSAAEQLCMSTIQGGTWAGWWAGGSDSAAEGQWRWVTGPEGAENGGAGRQFWQGGPVQIGGTTTAPDFFADWYPPPGYYEPNNSGNEDYLSWNTGGGVAGGNNHWNDVGHANPAVCGYAVEFDTDPDGPADLDGDGVADDSDNCPDVANPDQADNDGDGSGDSCDEDDDDDGIADVADNCPFDPNPLQEDFDIDGIGNACDATFDGDDLVQDIESLVLAMRALVVDVNPPGANGMVAKLTGRGGVLAKVDSALTAFGAGLTDVETYLSELEDALDKLTSFDNQLAAKVGNGQIPAVTEGEDLAALSADVRAILDALVAAVGG